MYHFIIQSSTLELRSFRTGCDIIFSLYGVSWKKFFYCCERQIYLWHNRYQQNNRVLQFCLHKYKLTDRGECVSGIPHKFLAHRQRTNTLRMLAWKFYSIKHHRSNVQYFIFVGAVNISKLHHFKSISESFVKFTRL